MSEVDPSVVLRRLRSTFAAGVTRPLSWRRAQLDGIARFVAVHEQDLLDALHDDLGRPASEAIVSELAFVTVEARGAARELARWTRARRAKAPLAVWPSRCRVIREPLGVVLVLGAWNFPVRLLLAPAIAAFAAGNTVCLKPSEGAPRTAAVLQDALLQYLDPDGVAIVTGGPERAQALLEGRFDHVFFTGSSRAGREVMAACARHPTPVTLELGGKCPCYVSSAANLRVAARRIVWGKFLNAGQTCVAPDYVLVDDAVKEPLITALVEAVRQRFGEDVRAGRDLGRIVNADHVRRLRRFLEVGEVRVGGEVEVDDRYVAPTILTGVPDDAAVMNEEIFGPILPVREVADRAAAIAFIAARPAPLAIYHFGGGAVAHREFLAGTRSGALVRDDVVVQMTASDLPFGGVGPSGFGTYHGRAGFETFSQRRASMERSVFPDPSLRYPPYSARKIGWLRRLMGSR